MIPLFIMSKIKRKTIKFKSNQLNNNKKRSDYLISVNFGVKAISKVFSLKSLKMLKRKMKTKI